MFLQYLHCNIKRQNHRSQVGILGAFKSPALKIIRTNGFENAMRIKVSILKPIEKNNNKGELHRSTAAAL